VWDIFFWETRDSAKMETGGENRDEQQYLTLVRTLLESSTALRENRTGIDTVSQLGGMARYSLRDGTIPLLTTKRVFWRGVVEELLWFIRGDTNANHLSEKGIKIWDANGTRAYLDSVGLLEREVGDLGPIYGFQWRHFGAPYETMHSDYEGKGFDQLAQCIEQIKTDPTSRRIIMTAWNPPDLGKMALPPCHTFCQFEVSDDGTGLSCLFFQRSCDMGLGVPFNIASYALLTHLVAHSCGLKACELVHFMGNVHIYVNHIDALKVQLERTPRPFPTLRIKCEAAKFIDQYTSDDIELVGYDPHPPIKMEMAV
jgi:thymidylate synthase